MPKVLDYASSGDTVFGVRLVHVEEERDGAAPVFVSTGELEYFILEANDNAEPVVELSPNFDDWSGTLRDRSVDERKFMRMHPDRLKQRGLL